MKLTPGSRWLVLGLMGAGILGTGLWTRRATREEPQGRITSPEPVSPPVITPETPGAHLSDMLKMASAAFAGCGAPAASFELPHGATATRDQMVAAHATVKAFDQATAIYTKCLDTTAYQAKVQFKGVASDADIQALDALQVRLHNEAIDQDQVIADRFNVQLRLFKARVPK